MPVVGEMRVEVSYGEQNAMLSLYVVAIRARSKPNAEIVSDR